jgi:hypothetical protein
MNAIPVGVIPPPNRLDQEEPELAEEDDIPSDDVPSLEDGHVGRE